MKRIGDLAKLIRCRDDFPFLFNILDLTGVGVEVGVKAGAFSEHILKHWEGGKLFSIDAWQERDDYLDLANVSQDEQEHMYKSVLMRLKPFGNRVTVKRDTSPGVASDFLDGILDFVYLDAAHDYESVMADIEAWLPKVRKGGVIAGHDFVTHLPEQKVYYPHMPDDLVDTTVIDVQRAVRDSFRNIPGSIWVTTDPFPSWWRIKDW